MMEKKTLVKYGIREAYKHYKAYRENPVSFKEFRLIWKTFIDKVTTGITREGRDFSMPYRLGGVGIRKRKIVVKLNPDGTIDKRALRPDWNATKLLWAKDLEAKIKKTLVFHLNKHFNGYNAKWFWDKSTCIVHNQTAYSLTLSRANKRKLSAAIFDEDLDIDYFEQKAMQYRN